MVHCRVVPGNGRHVGFVVAKTVGGAVVRNRVRRRLRGVVVEQSDTLPDGVDLVVRALPAAASATYGQLDADFRSAVAAASRRATERSAR